MAPKHQRRQQAGRDTLGIHVSHDTVWRFLRRQGLSFKKTLLASETDRPKLTRLRARWRAHQHRIDPTRLIVSDETWVKTNMTRSRGWNLRGTSLIAKVPHGHWKTLTFLAELRHDRIVAPCVIDGPINGLSFTGWVTQFLAPTLSPGDIVIADNLGNRQTTTFHPTQRKSASHAPDACRRRPDHRDDGNVGCYAIYVGRLAFSRR